MTSRLTLAARDGDEYLNEGFLRLALPAGQTPADLVAACVGQSSVAMEAGLISEKLSEKKLARGKVLFGQPKDYLRGLARSESAAYYVDDGKVCFIRPRDVRRDQALLLTPETGLVGCPEQTEEGVKGRALLSPLIKLNGLIALRPEHIGEPEGGGASSLSENGLYRVIKLTHSGDTRDTEWYTEFEAVAQPGEVPSLMAHEDINPF